MRKFNIISSQIKNQILRESKKNTFESLIAPWENFVV